MLYDIDRYRHRSSDLMNRFTGKDILSDYPFNREGTAVASGPYPAINIMEYDSEYVIEVAAPGLCKEDYDLTVNGNMLRISSSKEAVDEDTAARYSRRDFGYSQFEKTFILPENADQENITASCKDGILDVHVQKKVINKESKSKIIKVK